MESAADAQARVIGPLLDKIPLSAPHRVTVHLAFDVTDHEDWADLRSSLLGLGPWTLDVDGIPEGWA